jgi:hypothetical protein
MKLNNDQKELLDLFVKQEILIGSLYQLFAKRYPDHKEFWTKMAREEQNHSALIKRIIESDAINFSQGELRSDNLISSIEYIESLISDFKKDAGFSINQAVSKALQIEKGLWERKIFQCFDGDSDEVKKIMRKLNVEQELHIQKIHTFACKL